MHTDSSFTFVLFGGTGDLSMRKILPALFEAHRANMLSEAGRIVAVARHAADREGYLQWVEEHVKPHAAKAAGGAFDEAVWRSFLERIVYVKLDLGRAEDYALLRDTVGGLSGIRVFYLATGPSLFVPICKALAAVGLNEGARIVLEKPLGYDLRSSNAINDAVGEIFAEDQIYRIDHYLGKEPVQNLLALRFGNALFEPLWRREWVESIQITIAEELGVEARGDFYDNTGALRDMVQNHLLQLLSIVAMEPPHSMDSDSVRDEKLRVLRALKPVDPRDIGKVAVRGQYHAGVIKGAQVPAYATEPGVKADSQTETFVALKVEIENWRWAGVPFFLRTGKRLADRVAEIVVNFRPVPHSALGPTALRAGANRLVIRLQPNESIRLYCLAKQPGEGMNLASVHLDLAFDQFFKEGQMEAYQRLLLDVINGRLALFVRRDEQEAAWRWVEPILNEWARTTKPPKPYAAGTWGPAAASAMLAQHGTCWLEEEN
ncbi:glucose-6-phosphate dehydrogenase [Burkholderia pseudomallei]|uniref:Glucose-6-phosphate 1-dehydrogenase n=8 Tax=pseudomallei group TaxID=111527 RepID=Q63RQ9_BURPS|nr:MULTISPECIES: glucose-6-phosphate dehydrogenase [Burkholderia]EIF68580.1 glucose-6-phosphate 1-dehydrogenase [Burkholderia pseudomallei 1258a]KGX76687.1 glucose-6-phosphate dehydrogenase [Burkholderia pseudomallei MSHR435]AAU49973.1 glucose-6-phosphate 1-dehydrogenase [Burkholderia mallei ATCC 23344]ABA50956.1 glucose-6-phosphate 1-dehydrogenase [Burkholderia pseudomallei 1710b]ABM52195.1 glucose-6-phosphate 1-dehydrogenase [Burkholderia mallei SAVP1]